MYLNPGRAAAAFSAAAAAFAAAASAFAASAAAFFASASFRSFSFFSSSSSPLSFSPFSISAASTSTAFFARLIGFASAFASRDDSADAIAAVSSSVAPSRSIFSRSSRSAVSRFPFSSSRSAFSFSAFSMSDGRPRPPPWRA